MTSCQAEPGIAHPTVVPASADPEGPSDRAEGEPCPECGHRTPARDH